MHHDRFRLAKKVTLIGAASNAILGFIKLVGGILFHSHALAADGIHSFSDLFTDIMVLFASKYGSQEADVAHPYGHQRIETAATLILALILILAGMGIAWDSLYEIIYKTHTMPSSLSLPIAALSILANEGMFHYTQHVGKLIRSDLIIANAWHHRSDAAASIVVLVGLIGSVAGYVYLDTLAAVIVGFMIVQMGWSYGWNSVKELVDTAVEPQIITKIEQIIVGVDGVQKIHQLRSRSMGRDIFIDVHVLVSPYISVSEGHYIAQHVHHALTEKLEHVKDVTVHIDPEDDETFSPSLHLPSRVNIENKILHRWRQEYPAIEHIVLHYLDGKLTIDVICEPKFNQWDAFVKYIQPDLRQEPQILCVRLIAAHQKITLAKCGL